MCATLCTSGCALCMCALCAVQCALSNVHLCVCTVKSALCVAPTTNTFTRKPWIIDPTEQSSNEWTSHIIVRFPNQETWLAFHWVCFSYNSQVPQPRKSVRGNLTSLSMAQCSLLSPAVWQHISWAKCTSEATTSGTSCSCNYFFHPNPKLSRAEAATSIFLTSVSSCSCSSTFSTKPHI